MATILIIDDDAAVRNLVASAITSDGHEALTADGGHPGMELARMRLPDLVISDVEMPGMDGRAFLAWLRNDPITSGIPVILMTGFAEKTSPRTGMNLGADDFLPKPFSIMDLLAAVKSRLKKREALQHSTQRKLAELSTNLSTAMPSELLNPLGDILSHVEILRLGAGAMDRNELLEFIGGIEQSAGRLHQSIQGYLFYAQAELMAARPEQIATARLGHTRSSKEVVEAWAGTVAERLGRSADLVLALAEGAAPIETSLLAKAVEILTEQALVCSPPATQVKLTTRLEPGIFVLAVEDSGRVRSFEQWNSSSGGSNPHPGATSATPEVGLHLGMAALKRLAEIHGGTLEVGTAIGGNSGTSVTMRLPF